MVGYAGGSTDWIGLDDGSRSIPTALANPDVVLPSESQARFDEALAMQLDTASKGFTPVMDVSPQSTGANQGYSFSFGNQIDFWGHPLGFTGSLTYGQRTSAYNNGYVGRWELLGGQVSEISELTPTRVFGGTDGYDRKGTQETDWGGLLSVSYKPHPNHSISTIFMRTQSGISEARDLAGFWQDLSGNSVFETRVLGYKERALNSLQFKGKHVLGSLLAEWKASFASNQQDEPDLRYFSNHYTVRTIQGETQVIYQRPASLYPAPTRFFRNLNESNNNIGIDITLPLALWNDLQSKIKVGVAYLDVSRTFRERRFEYREGSGISYQDFNGDNKAYFGTVGILEQSSSGRYIFGNYIADVSSDRSNYDGAQTVTAAYAMTELPITKRLRLIGGVRLEITDMLTESHDESLEKGILDNKDWLPSVNLVYELPNNMNIRAAATKTLARPTFRELAPYATFDFVGDFVFRGNANLKRTLITNYDLRWEWFSRPGEIVAISGFYKDFLNPIENVIQTSTGNNSMSVQNVETARVQGIEVEFRSRLDKISNGLKYVMIGGNVTFVHSEVDIPEEELEVIRVADPDASATRSLEGQSPYVINADVSYDNYESGTTVGLYFNVFGERLITVSEGAAPDIFERPRNTLDFILSKSLGENFRLKLSAKNLLDAQKTTSQVFKGQEYIYNQYTQGRSFSLGVTYSL